MLSSYDLARMQTTVIDSFPSVGTVYTNAGATDPTGAKVESFTVSGTVPCLILPSKTPVEIVAGDTVRSVPGFNIHLGYLGTVTAADRVACNGITFEIVGSDKGMSNQVGVKLTAVIVR